MTDKEILEGDKLIAEFMGCYGSTFWAGGEEVYRYGFDYTHITERWHESEFDTATPYHSSWDWLMPVVDDIYYCRRFDTGAQTGEISSKPYKLYANIKTALLHLSIEQTWKAVVLFIQNHKTPTP